MTSAVGGRGRGSSSGGDPHHLREVGGFSQKRGGEAEVLINTLRRNPELEVGEIVVVEVDGLAQLHNFGHDDAGAGLSAEREIRSADEREEEGQEERK